jgi:pyrroloquinoline quinone biosynthesis protein B
MWARVLGSAAGGGYPQWNCACPPCAAVRDGSRPARPRTQSSVAVSGDYRHWYLINASPDIHRQVESFAALHPRAASDGGRVVPIRAILLTDAELDHTLGLLLLREGTGCGLEVHATAAAREVLVHGTGLLPTLEAYCAVRWVPVVPGQDVPLGEGLSYRAFDVPTTKAPRFGGAARHGPAQPGRVVGYRVTDERTGQCLACLPGVQELTAPVQAQLDGCACLLIDGTCWRDDELIALGLARKTARDMGHVPISGPGGSLERLAALPADRKVYIHLNNTNPVLIEDSAERRLLARHGMEVATDGMEIAL